MVTEVATASLPTHDNYPAPADVDVNKTAQEFLKQLEDAASGDGSQFASLFIKDGYWRDVLAFTRDFRTIDGAKLAEVASVRRLLVRSLTPDHIPQEQGAQVRPLKGDAAGAREPVPGRDVDPHPLRLRYAARQVLWHCAARE